MQSCVSEASKRQGGFGREGDTIMTTPARALGTRAPELDEYLIALAMAQFDWPREKVIEKLKSGAIKPKEPLRLSVTEVSEQLRAQARKEGRMAVIRSVYHVNIVGKGPSFVGNAPCFSGGRLDAFDYAKEASERTGLPIIETGCNARAEFDKPGVYLRPEVFDEMRPGETRCFRTYGGSHY
jgi:hypothetical protein